MTAAVSSTGNSSAAEAIGFVFGDYLEAARLKVESALDGSLGPERPECLREARRYCLLSGRPGFRPRPFLAACERAGVWSATALRAGGATTAGQ